jgi:ABC-type glutathione transport system ATPase component
MTASTLPPPAAGAAADAVIEAEGLEKRFTARGKAVQAVAGLSFAVASGEIFGLLGPNGAGKPNLGNWQFFLPARKDPLAGRNG